MLLGACLAEGREAGRAGRKRRRVCRGRVATAARPTTRPAPSRRCGTSAAGKNGGKAFVDFQNDVTAADIALAAREGFRSVEHLKRYTTLGMATDQGKTVQVNGLAIMAVLTGETIPADRHDEATARRIRPVAIGALRRASSRLRIPPDPADAVASMGAGAGRGFRRDRPVAARAIFPAGRAKRAGSRRCGAKSHTVRSGVGFCDVSTLGKIDVHGPDAGIFLDRLYINTFSNLPVGRARYGVMLREDGFVVRRRHDVAARRRPLFHDDHHGQCRPRVPAHAVLPPGAVAGTRRAIRLGRPTQWAQYSVAGPRARDTLRKLVDPPFDIANADFPYMGVAECTVCGGMPARLYRLSFSGELAYEIGVPTRYGDALARALMQAGQPFGIAPYGTEALGRDAHREGPRRRQRDRWPHHGATTSASAA